MMDSLLGQRYEVRQEIGRGGYGQVCKGYDHERGRKVAIKLEKVDDSEGEVSYLKKEEDVYSKLKGEESFGIANIHHFGADLIHDDPGDGLDNSGYILHYMVMDLLGPDLEELLTECSEQFSLKTVLLLADQMIRIIQYVHSKDYIHGDIKPTNFVLGRGKKGSNMIYMVDFGLAQRYRDSQTKEHIAYSDTTSYAGTTMFTSLNCHLCIQKSRRDDLESLGYVLVYFLCGSLPWQAIKDWNDKSEKRRLVYEKKASISIEELCTGLPCEFVKYMEYCRLLQFDEEPDYDYLREMFQDLYDQAGFTDVVEYDWTLRERKAQRYYLKSQLNSSQVHPEEVFFYFNVEYKPIQEPHINLETIEECLEHIFKFVASEHELNTSSENDFKWDNMSMSDIIENYVQYDKDIAWIYKHDKLDWESASEKQENKMRKFFTHFGDLVIKPGIFFMQSAYDVYLDRKDFETKSRSSQKRNMGKKSEGIKRFFDSLTLLTSPQSYMRNGACVEHLDLKISEDLITDESQFLESRTIQVTVKPDGVFTNPSNIKSNLAYDIRKWEIVLEVYGPSAENVLLAQDDESEYSRISLLKSPPSAGIPDNKLVDCPNTLTSAPDQSSKSHTDSGFDQTLMVAQSCSSNVNKDSILAMDTSATKSLEAGSIPPSFTSGQGHNTLSRKRDMIANPAYRKCIREEIEKSLPSNCRGHTHTMRTMAGQHVLQLFAQVKRRHMATEGHEGKGIDKSIGMFAINEFVYFSRLDMSYDIYRMVLGEYSSIRPHRRAKEVKQNPPEVCFSNFRLNITKKNHRLALVLFLKKYLYPKVLLDDEYPSTSESED